MVCPLTQLTNSSVIEELPGSVRFLEGPRELLTDASPGSEQIQGRVNAGRGHAPSPPSLPALPKPLSLLFKSESNIFNDLV